MTAPAVPCHHAPARYCGRDFTPAELAVIARLAATLPSRAAISRAVCDTLGWITPDGRRKDMTGAPRVWWRLDSPQMLWSGWPLSSTVPPPGGTTV